MEGSLMKVENEVEGEKAGSNSKCEYFVLTTNLP